MSTLGNEHGNFSAGMSPLTPNQELSGVGESVVKRPKKRSIACQRCHAQKIKCSGGKPCSKCRLAGCASECRYALRDRKLRINESDIERLLMENQQLKDENSSLRYLLSNTGSSHRKSVDEPESHVQNPLLGDQAWFESYDPSKPPIFVGEAACTTFATHLYRCLAGHSERQYIPTARFTDEVTLSSMMETPVQWPSMIQARLLIKVMLSRASPIYHLALRPTILQEVEEVYRTSNFHNPVVTCKFFALFALGEVFSAMSNLTSGGSVPGTAYYVHALRLIPILPEKPSISHVESFLLLSVFSHFLNRQNSAFVMIGTALRLALTLGLNYNIVDHPCISTAERQHRIRLWWGIYIFDRFWVCKMGFPIQVQDEDIHVDMPSDLEVYESRSHDLFSEDANISATIQLGKISGETTQYIYSRRRYNETFLQREQRLLIQLKQWLEDLPGSLRLDPNKSNQNHVIVLHLQFNHCFILATRPVLLYALNHIRKVNTQDGNGTVTTTLTSTVLTLSGACIHAARHSHSLILEQWVNGSLPPFGYFYAQYLFSTALILAISSLVPFGHPNDSSSVETTLEMLNTLSRCGNPSASDLYGHLERIQSCLWSRAGDNPPPSVVGHVNPHTSEHASNLPVAQRGTAMESRLLAPTLTASNVTAEMAFSESPMQEFLSLSNLDLGLLDVGEVSNDELDASSLWPMLPMWTT